MSLDTFTEVGGGGRGRGEGKPGEKPGRRKCMGGRKRESGKQFYQRVGKQEKVKFFLEGGGGSCSTYISANLMQEMTKRLSSVSDVMQTSW